MTLIKTNDDGNYLTDNILAMQYRLLSCQNLQEYNSKAIHITLICQLTRQQVFRIKVTLQNTNHMVHSTRKGSSNFLQSNIRPPWLHVHKDYFCNDNQYSFIPVLLLFQLLIVRHNSPSILYFPPSSLQLKTHPTLKT